MAADQTTSEKLAAINAMFKREITAPKAHAAHLAAQAQIAEISRQHAEAIKTAPGYSHAMGCFLSPKAEIAFLNSQLDAAHCAVAQAAE